VVAGEIDAYSAAQTVLERVGLLTRR
jgi:hypothetical protein